MIKRRSRPIVQSQPNREDGHHQAEERNYWAQQLAIARNLNKITLGAAFAAFGAACAALVTLWYLGRQTDTADENMRVSQRAYIVVSELRLEQSAANGVIHATPVIKNSGLTPATDVSIANVTPHNEWARGFDANMRRDQAAELAWKMGAPRDPDELGDTPIFRELALNNLVIGPSSSITASSLADDFNADAGIQASSNKIGRFFYGSVHYTDVFGEPHVSKYCFRIDNFTITLGTVQTNQNVCRHWNCIDSGCKKDRDAYDADMRYIVAHPEDRFPLHHTEVGHQPAPGPAPSATGQQGGQ